MPIDFLNARMKDLQSCGILGLVEELEAITPVRAEALPSLTLWQFLTQCVYPGGLGGKRAPLDARSLPDQALLNSPVRKLQAEQGDLFELCRETALRNRVSLEFFLGRKLATFLNSNLPKFPPVRKISSRRERENEILLRRRKNRH